VENSNFAAGEKIFDRNDTSPNAYLVISGTVEISRGDFSAAIQEGELFGEAALFDRPRTASAVAKTDCVLLSVSKAELMETIKTEPDEALDIIEAMLRRLGEVTDQLNYVQK
jgi:CRP/FNR family transcriptional regulator, cyclic AMP receptor protein